jgi:hypothetical protein
LRAVAIESVKNTYYTHSAEAQPIEQWRKLLTARQSRQIRDKQYVTGLQSHHCLLESGAVSHCRARNTLIDEVSGHSPPAKNRDY